MKVFAISNTSGSPWIHPPCNSGLAEMEKGPVVGRLSFTELRRSGMRVIVPVLGTGLPSSSGEDWSGLHHHGVTLPAPQVVLHSDGPHLSSRALLHKAPPPSPPGTVAFPCPGSHPSRLWSPSPPSRSHRSLGHLQQLPRGTLHQGNI